MVASINEWSASGDRNKNEYRMHKWSWSLRYWPSLVPLSFCDSYLHELRHGHRIDFECFNDRFLVKNCLALLSGIFFGIGLTLSGMSDPAKVIGFLDISGNWTPDLLFVMGGALTLTMLGTPKVLGRGSPLLANSFSLPEKYGLDFRLASGSMLFGIGWGLSGYCPGPALVSLIYGYSSTILFCIAMLIGMTIGTGFEKYSRANSVVH